MQTKQHNFSCFWCWLVSVRHNTFSLCTDHLNVLLPLKYFLSAFYQALYQQNHFSNDLLLHARQGISRGFFPSQEKLLLNKSVPCHKSQKPTEKHHWWMLFLQVCVYFPWTTATAQHVCGTKCTAAVHFTSWEPISCSTSNQIKSMKFNHLP